MRQYGWGSGGRRAWSPGVVLPAALFLGWLVSFFVSDAWTAIAALPFGLGSAFVWKLVTYPLVFERGDLLGLLFSCLIAYWTANALSARLGATGVWKSWLLASVLGGVMWLAGGLFAGAQILYGPNLPLAAFLCLWAAWNKSAKVMLFMIIPVPAPVIAILSVLGVLVSFGMQNPLAGVLPALVPVAYWLYGDGKLKLPGFATQSGRSDKRRTMNLQAHVDEAKRREIEREERERLRRLFEASLEEDPPDR
jgi:hypothetical protein